MAAKIGSLLITLALDSGAFKSGLTQARKELQAAQRSFQQVGQTMQSVGQSLTASLTVPIAAAGFGVVRTAGNFEAAMGRIAIASEASAAELKQMSEIALQVGKDTIFGATEAAGAMEMLAKAGVDTKVIIGGAAKAVTDLAAAAGSELEPAANAISDSLAQFNLKASDLPRIVNQITGAVNESKFAFDDFTYGMAQGGGVAASAGMSFEDFAATLAATSSQFQSGADAGTSLKTFLLNLTPTTDKAAAAMSDLGLKFFDAQGKMLPMRDIAQELQDTFAEMSDETRNSAMKELFGTDAIRTAVGLMKLGAKGIDEITAKLARTDAADQAAKRMEGFNGQLKQLRNSLEALAIRIGQSGILETVTGMVTALSNLIDKLSEASPGLLKLATGAAVVAAALGPVLWLGGAIVEMLAPLAAILSTGGLAALGATFAGIGAAIAPALPVIAALASAGALIYANWDKIGPALNEFAAAARKAIGPELQAMVSETSAALTELWNGPIGQGIRDAVSAWGDFQVAYLKAVGPVFIEGLKLAVAALGQFVENSTAGLQLVSRLLSGDFSGAMQAALRVASGVFLGIPELVAKMVRGVSEWIRGKLQAVWDSALAKIEQVKQAFFKLYDAVVGNSYVPDMVDGIAREMARLDAVMVAPVKKATDKARQAFADLARDTRAIMDRLFPEAAALNTLQGDRGTIEAARAGGLLSAEAAAAASAKLLDQFRNDNPLAGFEFPPTILADTEALAAAVGTLSLETSKAGSTWASVFEEMGVTGQDVLRDISRSLTDAVLGARSLGEALRGVLQRLAEMALDAVFQRLLGGLFKTIGIPGFAGGTNFAPGGLALVGERGPELVNLPRGSQVIDNGETNRMLAARSTVHSPTFVFPGITDARQAREAAGQAARRYRQEMSGPLRRAG